MVAPCRGLTGCEAASLQRGTCVLAQRLEEGGQPGVQRGEPEAVLQEQRDQAEAAQESHHAEEKDRRRAGGSPPASSRRRIKGCWGWDLPRGHTGALTSAPCDGSMTDQ